MKVILQERIPKLGQIGDVVNVRNGYGRNYLIPQGKANYATPENIAYFESNRKALEMADIATRDEAKSLVPRFDGVVVRMVRAASETGQLYGSIRPRDVVASLSDQDISVAARQVVLSSAIKHTGDYQILIALHHDVEVSIRLLVGRSEDEIDTLIAEQKAAKAKEEAAKKAKQEAQELAKASGVDVSKTDAKTSDDVAHDSQQGAKEAPVANTDHDHDHDNATGDTATRDDENITDQR